MRSRLVLALGCLFLLAACSSASPGSPAHGDFKIVGLLLNVLGSGGAAMAWMVARRRSNRGNDLDALKTEIEIRLQLADQTSSLTAAERRHMGTKLDRVALPDRRSAGLDPGFMWLFGACAAGSGVAFGFGWWWARQGDADHWWWMLLPGAVLAFLGLLALVNAMEGRRLILR